MAASPPRRAATTPKPELIHTQLGFDLLADPKDYVSSLLIRDGLYKAPETELLIRILRPGDICISAGCPAGYYSCLMAKLVGSGGRVFSFDASLQACQSTQRNAGLNGLDSIEVIHAALMDHDADLSFHLSPDGHTEPSSSVSIPAPSNGIPVPHLRLETFADRRHIGRVRLLRLAVDGAEEIALRGLGRYLTDHAIDFILTECHDERLRLWSASTEKVAAFLASTGYTAWEFDTRCSAIWSQVTEVRGGATNRSYLFSRPSLTEGISSISLAKTLNQLLADREKLQDDIDWLLDSIRTLEASEAHAKRLTLDMQAEVRRSEGMLHRVQNSTTWRILHMCRRLQNRLIPESSRRRRLYDFLMRRFRSQS
jgi:FkbM family methyltransferase